MSAGASTASSLVSWSDEHVHAVAQLAAQRSRAAARARHDDRRLPVELRGQPAQRAQEQPQRGALLVGRRRRSARRPSRGGACEQRRRPGGARGSRRGRSAASGRAVASKRAHARVEAAEEQLDEARATCVESTRSAGAWNVPTLSAREWRSAADDALGANGSWTWHEVERPDGRAASSIVRATSTGGAGIAPRRGAGERQQLADAEHAHAAVGVEQLAAADARATRARARRSWDGASDDDRCPRRPARRASARTKALTSCSSSQGYGETWAMEKGTRTARAQA